MQTTINEWLTYQSTLGRTERTLKEYRKRLRYFNEFANLKIVQNVSLKIVRNYHDSLIQRGLKTGSRLAFLSTVKAFLEWCYQRGRILTNIANRIELPTREQTLPPLPLSGNDIEKLFKLATTETIAGKRNLALLEILYGCGLRRAEVLSLNLGDVDFQTETIFVHGKGQKDRILPINQIALRSIAEYLQLRGGRPKKASPLFIVQSDDDRTKRLSGPNIDSLFNKLNKRFYKHVHPHLLRHTFAVHLLQGGADIRYVQALLGHESPDTTSVYLGLVKGDIKRFYDDAVERMLDE